MNDPAGDSDARRRFEQSFYASTVDYLQSSDVDPRPVSIIIGADAHCTAGHALLCTLVNQLARAHRKIRLIGELDEPLLCGSPFAARTLTDATVQLAKAINPFVQIEVSETSTQSSTDAGLTLGLGSATDAQLRLGADGFIADLSGTGEIVDRPATCWGALLAACLGANIAFHWAHRDTPVAPIGRFSLWELGAPDGADGPSDPGPLDVGCVLQAGVGAVGCALDLACVIVGIRGTWTIIDGDLVEMSNLNRQVMFLAGDGGWPVGPAANKALTVARRLQSATGAEIHSSPHWLDESPQFSHARYDVVLALANDRGARSALQASQPTVLMHSTTSRKWQAQVHRHVAGHDDCIDCRIPPDAGTMACATGVLPTPQGSRDAALPFLSMTAGVLLAAQLARLQHGALLADATNQVVFDMAGPEPVRQIAQRGCRRGCLMRLPAPARAALDQQSQWAHLDGGD